MRRRLVGLARSVLGVRYEEVRAKVFGYPLPLGADERATRLIEAGLFDAEYYISAAALPAGTDDYEAARHYVTDGAAAGLAFHPLIEPEYLPQDIRRALESGEVEHAVAHLSGSMSNFHRWGPLFDPSRVSLPPDAESVGRAVILGLTDETVLPVPGDYAGPVPTFAEMRRSAIAHVASAARQRSFRVATTSATWDVEAEQAWTHSVESVAVPKHTDLPTVTIVMPVWNRADIVALSIESVLAQSLSSWELIVVDDGSTDQTFDVVSDYAELDGRITIVREDHRGVCAARNLGLELAQAEFVAFLDSDNTWTPDFLERALKGMVGGGHDVVYAGIEIREPDGEVRYRGMQVDAIDLTIDNSIDMNCLIARTDVVRAIGGFDESLRRWVDHDLVLRLSARTRLQFLPFIGCSYEHHTHANRITNRESANWQFVVLGKAIVDWQAAAAQVERRVPGRTSVVMLTYQDHHRTVRAIDEVLATTADQDVEVVLVDNGSRHAVGRVLDARYKHHPRVEYHRLRRNYNFATGANYGFTRSTGEFVMFLNNDTEVRAGWLPPLLDGLQDADVRGIQPLLTYPDGTVQTAGTVFPLHQGLPCHFLARHPIQDAHRHDGDGFHAITAGAMLVRARDFQLMSGFDPIFANGLEDVDFCLRATQRLGGSYRVVAGSVVIHEESRSPGRFAREEENRRVFLERWSGGLPGPDTGQYEKLSLVVAHTTPDLGTEHGLARPLVIRPRRLTTRSGVIRPSLRWAIKIGAANTPAGDLWGDVAFADDLAQALRGLDQESVIDRHEAFGRPTAYLDDVVLTIRGRHPAPPQSGRLNVLWVISRPELVSIAEVRSYDLVFAASAKWAEWMSSASGRPVEVLLQATNPDRFHDLVDPADQSDEFVFVGGPRPGQGRRIVTDALESGLPLSLWGPDWANYVPSEIVRGPWVAPHEIASVYRSARVVLNDHLPEMAVWGFMSNRLFDAVASGSPVITDSIDGLDLFDGAVVSYDSVDHLSRLADSLGSWQPTRDRLQEIAARVRLEHSFAARAETLLDAVLAHRATSS